MEMAATAVPTMRVWLFDVGGAKVEFCCPLSVSNMAQEAQTYLANLLAGGFSRTMPGMEKGEYKEMAGFVVRQQKREDDGTLTPILLFYPADEAKVFSFIKVWLNNENDIYNAEKAMGIVLTSIPLYVGKDKPERTPDMAEWFKPLPKPVEIIYKDNPDYNPEEKDIKKKRPQFKFVRFAALPTADKPTAPAATEPPPAGDQPATTKASNKTSEGLQAVIVRVDVAEWEQNGKKQHCYDLYTSDSIKIRYFGSHTELVKLGVDALSTIVVGASIPVDPFVVTYKEKIENGYARRQWVAFVGPAVPEMDVPF